MSKPLVTFGLLAYNQERYIREAVRGALSQTYSPLEIIISDDCSWDRTFEIIEEEVAGYEGPHKIVLNRNEKNLGIGGHVNRLMELSEGELIVSAAGDDISLPHRTEELAKVWSRGGIFSVYSNMDTIDENGVNRGAFASVPPLPIKSYKEMLRNGYVFGCTHAWDRSTFDIFGPLPDTVVHEDMTIPFRSALLGEIAYIDECLVKYRRHSSNVWKDADMVAMMTWSEYVKHRTRQAEMDFIHYGSWLRDLQVFLSAHPEKESEITKVREVVQARIEVSKFESGIGNFSSKDRLQRLLSAIGSAQKLGVKSVVKVGLMGVAPQTYYRIQKFRGSRR